MKIKKEIFKKAANIKLLVSDVDGVLTGGEIIILNNGEEIKIWNVKDGLGYHELEKISPKIKTAWITGRKSVQVAERAKSMKIDYLVQDCMSKKEALFEILKKSGVKLSETAYAGDDIVDMGVMSEAGFSVCPADANDEVKRIADFVSSFNGGKGVIRETIEIILKAKGEWNNVLKRYK